LASNKKRIPRTLTEDEVRRLTSLKPDDVTKDLMISYFSNFEDQESQFIPQDNFVLRKEVVNNYSPDHKVIAKEDIHTTIGRYIVNLFLVFSQPQLLNKVGYLNYTMDAGKIADLSNAYSSLIITGEVKTTEFYDYLNRLQWLGFANAPFITPSVNYDIIKPLPKVMERKKELIKENEEAIENGDLRVTSAIEKELVELSKNELKDNPARALYDSGAKVDWSNQYKNMNIMCGPLMNLSSGGYRTVTNSFVEGLKEEDVAANADSLIVGVYSRAVATREGGYAGKKVNSAFQSIVLDKEGTDCGSIKYFKILLTKENKGFFKYRYIKKGNSLLYLSEEELEKQVGNYVELRSPLYCKGKCICNKCAGELYYKLGIRDIGLTANKVTSIAMNSALKMFHDQSIKSTTIDYKAYFD
jgi:hypothetical protein